MPRGRRPDSLAERLAYKFDHPDDGKPAWGCRATGCPYNVKGHRSIPRVLRHMTEPCTFLRDQNPELYAEAVEAASGNSLGGQLEKSEGTIPDKDTEEDTKSSGGLLQHVSSDGKLKAGPLLEAGRKRKAEEKEKLNLEVNHIIVRLISVRGLVPNLLDSPEWKELMNKLNHSYNPSSADTFREKFIPFEAVHVRKKQIELLKKHDNLTLTFDGTTIRKLESFYTAHATTPLRNSYLLDGHEGSGEHHDTQWITSKLLKVCCHFIKYKLS